MEDQQVSTERLVEACASLEADVLCLQEVDRNQDRSGHVDQTAAVAQATGAASWRFEPALIGEPGAQWRPAGPERPDRAGSTGPERPDRAGSTGPERPDRAGSTADAEVDAGAPAYGVGLVSRALVEDWHVVRMAAAGARAAPRSGRHSLRAPVLVPGTRRFIMLADEPRVALAADVGPFVVATTHLSFVPGWNAVQLRRLTAELASRGRPCVLLGDLNLPGPFPRWASGWRPMARLKTYPAANPSWQVDHALGFGELPEVVGVAAPRLALSDHRALVVDLEESR